MTENGTMMSGIQPTKTNGERFKEWVESQPGGSKMTNADAIKGFKTHSGVELSQGYVGTIMAEVRRGKPINRLPAGVERSRPVEPIGFTDFFRQVGIVKAAAAEVGGYAKLVEIAKELEIRGL